MSDLTVREEAVEALALHRWTDSGKSAHRYHRYYAECAVCQGNTGAMVAVVLEVAERRSRGQRDELERLRTDDEIAQEQIGGLNKKITRAEKRAGRAEVQRDALKAAARHLAANWMRRAENITGANEGETFPNLTAIRDARAGVLRGCTRDVLAALAVPETTPDAPTGGED